MYAIIRAGGKQAKVQSGDVIEIERVKGDAEEMSFSPLLIVDDKGNAVSDRDLLAKASVTAKVLGESQGQKIDIFKYKNKTGYRRRQGHRQKYTQIEITDIKLPGAKAKTTTAKAGAAKATEAKSAAPKSTAAKTTAAKTATTKAGAAKTTVAKTATTKAGAAKTTVAKTATTKAGAAKTSKQAKSDSSEEE
jgi:large subunit ribosomal protein L21